LGGFFDFFMAALYEAKQERDGHTESPFLATVNEGQSVESKLVDYPPGTLRPPWSGPLDELAPEEEETPNPVSFNDDILHFMEMAPEEARKEYLDMLSLHVSDEMQKSCPHIMELLRSEKAMKIFVPTTWEGLKVLAATFNIVGELPGRLSPKARPIRPQLYANAKKEFDRLLTYFYELSNSPIASPLVIAPKATAPFIRFCGDYREVNKYVSIPQQPIPIVQHELIKAAKFRIYVDLDMANSFHQIPLTPEFSDLLSVQTPWGLFRPKFLPEGVGPASGLLQHLVRDIFADFSEWTIVIFDNFLVLADDYDDAYQKLVEILDRCASANIVLKMKKSWIGVTTVTFFGYEVTHGQWRLSQTRKDAIMSLVMPTNLKQMQSFLGAALFFHHHVPNYSEWAARLYEMTAATFDWSPATWEYDYVSHFERFKQAVVEATTLYFPDYSLPWVIRCDASQYAVGAVLYQEKPDDSDTSIVIHQPIAFASRRFSKPAQNWDTFKREAYGLYFAVLSFVYYLRGKTFDAEVDHRNLQYMETSQSPIIIRWRAFLQSFNFRIRHIPGKLNTVADWMSRQYLITGVEEGPSSSTMHFDEMMAAVHGGRQLHYGAAETWRRAKDAFPDARVTIAAVREWVRQCPMCQKTRDTGVRGLPEQKLTLKPTTYRRCVGIDHVTVTPADEHGNTCVILIVEHFSHFPQAYAVKDYTAETVALTLFKHFCTFGVFDELASDPGSAFMSEVLKQLLLWLGVSHKVSLVGRHESNGCEGSGKQFLRHLRTLVLDERLVHKWSDDTVLPLINFSMASYPTSETGGFTPFQLKYGTQDANYFRLPESVTMSSEVAELIRRLDANLQIVRQRSHDLQQEIVRERSEANGSPKQYEPGDLVLWNPRESPSDFLATKLQPDWAGPYEVLRQAKNDVTCKHLVLGTEKVLHVTRLKPFLGSRQAAYDIAKLDENQFTILSINFYTGNPHLRSSLVFDVTFEDETVAVGYSADLASSQQLQAYILSRAELFPLRFSATEAKLQISKMRKLAITQFAPGDKAYLYLRFFDGLNQAWYDACVPEHQLDFYVEIFCVKWLNSRHTKILVRCEVFNDSYELNTYDVYAYCIHNLNPQRHFQLVADMQTRFPQIFQS
jgi:hypothetical protein